jgi:hypothetical protein
MRHVGEARREGPRRELRIEASAQSLGGMAEAVDELLIRLLVADPLLDGGGVALGCRGRFDVAGWA